jgi:integral membrane sensor domain MASE1
MQSRWWQVGIVTTARRTAILAAAYAATGAASLLLAGPPGYAAPIWPPVGIALALVLLWGFRVWPSVWIGSFAVNAWTGWMAAGGFAADAMAVAAAIATGSTLQILVGAWLVRQFVG